uniref:Glucagon n=1 Tax=Sinocyclocheilus grahami TaxID=75366 RepID=A0A672NRI6_SINGR
RHHFYDIAEIFSICNKIQQKFQVQEVRNNFRIHSFLQAKPLVCYSEGTFSNDYSKYLETRRAQDFVQWLMNSKRNGGSAKRHAEGTYTSDVSSYLQDQAAQNFVAWLKSGQPKQE